MKKLTLTATGLLVALAGSAFAAPPKMAPKMAPKMSSHMTGSKMMSSAKPSMTQMTGTVVSMTAHTLTVAPVQKNKMGAKKTIMIPASAKIMMGSKMLKLSGLKAGEKVLVAMKGGAVTSVKVMSSMMKTSSSKMSSSKMSSSKMNKMK